MKGLLITIGLFSFTACVATLTPEGGKVRVTENSQATVGCTFISNIKAPDEWTEGDSTPNLQNQAAKLGGNLVFLGRKTGVQQNAEVYRCPNQRLKSR